MAVTGAWDAWRKALSGVANSVRGPAAPGGPAQPSWPNPGTYDPTFDLNRENAQTGYNRYQSDFTRDWGELGAGANGGRNAADLSTALGRQGEQAGWNAQDYQSAKDGLTRNFNRSTDDLLAARSRGTADHATQLADLRQSYQRLGNNQAQQMRASGVAQGGAAIQAAQKRKGNEAHDQAPIDTNYNRFLADSQTAQSRLGEDNGQANLQLDRQNARGLTQGGWQNTDLNQQYGRGRTDALTDYGRNTTDLSSYIGGQGRLAYYNSGSVQAPGVSILDMLRRRNG